jgi:hypothetical protein
VCHGKKFQITKKKFQSPACAKASAGEANQKNQRINTKCQIAKPKE